MKKCGSGGPGAVKKPGANTKGFPKPSKGGSKKK